MMKKITRGENRIAIRGDRAHPQPSGVRLAEIHDCREENEQDSRLGGSKCRNVLRQKVRRVGGEGFRRLDLVFWSVERGVTGQFCFHRKHERQQTQAERDHRVFGSRKSENSPHTWSLPCPTGRTPGPPRPAKPPWVTGESPSTDRRERPRGDKPRRMIPSENGRSRLQAAPASKDRCQSGTSEGESNDSQTLHDRIGCVEDAYAGVAGCRRAEKRMKQMLAVVLS